MGLRLTTVTADHVSEHERLGLGEHMTSCPSAVCFMPISELQGGYNAKHAKKAVFVQVTVAEKHSLKLSFFLEALEALGIPPGRAWKVEIIILIP